MSSSLCTGYTFGERLAVYFSIQSSCLSIAAVLTLLAYALYRWVKRRGTSNASDFDASGSGVFLNLMVADLLQAIGVLPSIRWMLDGHITEGTLCTAQAVIKQIGINNVALSSLCIAVHTFSVLVLRWRVPRHASLYTILFIWTFIAFVVGIPNAVYRHDLYYGDTGYWCWIVTEFKAAQIMSEYIWVWCSGIIMTLLYGVMALVMRGFLIIGDGQGIRWVGKRNRVRLDLAPGDEEEKAAQDMANLLLFYPAVYVLCFISDTISRWLYFSGHIIPYQFTLFASSIFQFSGLFNVILYFSTRKEYAVGPSSSSTVITTLPPSETKPPLSPNTSAYKVEEDLELEETRYGTVRHPSYQSSTTHNSGSANGGSRLFQGTVLYQSPSARTIPLGAQSPVGASSGHLSPHSDVNSTHAHSTHASRVSPLNRSDYDDDDDNDYGRLPN